MSPNSSAMNSDSPFFTIITPTYNRRQILPRAIASVQNQTIGNYEHIIVDDGSTDGTGELVGNYSDPRIIYVATRERMGVAAAHNIGLGRANADIITFLDSDDEFLPCRLEHVSEMMHLHARAPFMLSSFMVKGNNRSFRQANVDGIVEGSQLIQALLWRGIHIATPSITARRQALEAVGGFNPSLRRMVDRDLLLRLAGLGSAYICSKIDWIKHNSPDAITLGKEFGGVWAFGELNLHNRNYADHAPYLIPCLVADRIIRELKKFRLSAAYSAFLDNRRHPALGYSPAQLLRCVGNRAAGRYGSKTDLRLKA